MKGMKKSKEERYRFHYECRAAERKMGPGTNELSKPPFK